MKPMATSIVSHSSDAGKTNRWVLVACRLCRAICRRVTTASAYGGRSRLPLALLITEAEETVRMASEANHQTVSEALDELAQLGFTANLSVMGNRLRVVETGRMFEPVDVVIRRVRRFEGVSDPDDMAIVYAIDTTSGIRGTVVDGYGVNSDPAVSAFFESVPIVEGAR